MKSDDKNIILTGFMGTGKTTVGRIVARELGRPFIDTDELIVAKTGLTITQLFADHGEGYFRRLESETLGKLTTSSGRIIATGGGSLLDAAMVERVSQSGLIFCLTATPEILMRRLEDNISRPLLSGGEDRRGLDALLAERESAYQRLPNHLDTSKLGPDDVAAKIIGMYRSLMAGKDSM